MMILNFPSSRRRMNRSTTRQQDYTNICKYLLRCERQSHCKPSDAETFYLRCGNRTKVLRSSHSTSLFKGPHYKYISHLTINNVVSENPRPSSVSNRRFRLWEPKIKAVICWTLERLFDSSSWWSERGALNQRFMANKSNQNHRPSN